MIELLVVSGLAAMLVALAATARRAALRRARARAEAVLDDLAAAACAALASGSDPSTSRRCARALDRYERTRSRVAGAHTRRELDMLVARHRMRQGAIRLATRGLERARDLVAEAVPARR